MSVRKSNTAGLYEIPSTDAYVAPSCLLEVISRLAAENVRLREDRKHWAEEKEEFLSLVCHELKTPLTAIKGYAQLLVRHLRGQTSDGVLKELEVIRTQTDRLSRLIDDVYDIVKLERDEAELIRRTLDMGELLQYALADLAPEDRHRFRLVDPADMPEIEVDPRWIKRAVSNLIDLALRSFRSGQDIVVATSVVEDHVVLTFSDVDAHFLPARRSDLLSTSKWQSFTSKSKRTSFGFGYYVSRAILAAHGGDVWVEQLPNGANTFVVVLPR